MESRIYLRALEPDDYKTSIKWRNDDEIWGMVGGPKYFVSEAYEKKWVEDTIFNSRDIKLAICLKEKAIHIGNVYVTDIDMTSRSCTTGVLIGEHDYWKQGYASEAYRLLLDYVFNERNLNRAQAFVLESNKASIKMHQKAGYKIEGTLRQSVYKNGRYQNQILLSILKEDYCKE